MQFFIKNSYWLLLLMLVGCSPKHTEQEVKEIHIVRNRIISIVKEIKHNLPSRQLELLTLNVKNERLRTELIQKDTQLKDIFLTRIKKNLNIKKKVLIEELDASVTYKEKYLSQITKSLNFDKKNYNAFVGCQQRIGIPDWMKRVDCCLFEEIKKDEIVLKKVPRTPKKELVTILE